MLHLVHPRRSVLRTLGLLFTAAGFAHFASAATPPTVVLADFETGISGVSAVSTSNAPVASASGSVVAQITDAGSGRLKITDANGGVNGAVALFTGKVSAPGYYLFTAEVKVDNASATVGSYGMAVKVGGVTTAKISDANAGYVRNLSGTGDAAKGYQTIGAAVNVPSGGTFPKDVAIYFSSDPSGNSYNAPSTDGNFTNAHRTNATAFAATNTNAVYVDNIKQIGPGNFGEERHLWISIGDGLTNLSGLDTKITQAKANGFNCIDILARYRANAYYVPNRDDNTYSNPEPMASGVSRTNDPLQFAIDKCHSLGMKVYISMSTFAVSESATYPSFLPSGSIMGYYNSGTPRAMTLADGGEGLWADVGRADVRNYTKNIAMDIISNYDIDGIIFDRVRYPDNNFGYNSTALSELGYSSSVPAPTNAAWRETRRQAVADFIQSTYEAITTKKPWIVVGATPIAYGTGMSDSYNTVLQGYNVWNGRKTANRNVDFGCLDLWQPQFYRLASQGSPNTAPASNDTLMKKLVFGDLSALSSDYGATPGASAFYAPLLYHPSSGDSAQSAANAQNASDTRFNGLNGFGFFSATPTLADISMIRTAANTSEGVDVLGSTPTFNDYLFKKGYDSTPPNAVTGVNLSLSPRGSALIKWNAPAPAADGDTASGYLIYASTSSSVSETYANLLTKKPITTNWYMPKVGVTGNYYYKIVSVDDYNNRGTAVSAGPLNVGGSIVPPADIIVDNPAATVTGSWTAGTSATDKYGTNYLSKSSGTGASKVAFNTTIATVGSYDVYEWHSAGTNRASNARHFITNSGATQTVTANQQANGGKWNKLATYNFNTGNHSVTIDDVFTGSVVIADAVKWSFNTGATYPTPAAPTALAATVTGASEVVLTWNDNATNETGYEVVRWRNGLHPTVISLPANSTGYADISVADGKTYNYLVRAYTSGSQSADSAIVTVSVPTYTPADIIVDDTAASYNIAWSAGTHAQQYGTGYKFASKNNGRVATFGFTPTKDGVYEIYEWHVASSNRAGDAKHIVSHSAGSTTVTVNQQVKGGQWNSIGQYQLLNGVAYNVKITDSFSVGDVIMADAIKVAYVNKIPVTVADIVLDNTDAAVVGTWTTGTSATDKYGSNYIFRGNSATGANTATYSFTLANEGLYEVYEWHCAGSNRTDAARHTVNHANGNSTVNVNQISNGGAWNSIGTYEFLDGVPYSVVVDDLFSTGSVVIVDGLKLVYRGELP